MAGDEGEVGEGKRWRVMDEQILHHTMYVHHILYILYVHASCTVYTVN